MAATHLRWVVTGLTRKASFLSLAGACTAERD